MVSAGVDEWHDYAFMHADYFAANQPVFDNELLDLCLRDAPDSVTFADPRCGEGAQTRTRTTLPQTNPCPRRNCSTIALCTYPTGWLKQTSQPSAGERSLPA